MRVSLGEVTHLVSGAKWACAMRDANELPKDPRPLIGASGVGVDTKERALIIIDGPHPHFFRTGGIGKREGRVFWALAERGCALERVCFRGTRGRGVCELRADCRGVRQSKPTDALCGGLAGKAYAYARLAELRSRLSVLVGSTGVWRSNCLTGALVCEEARGCYDC